MIYSFDLIALVGGGWPLIKVSGERSVDVLFCPIRSNPNHELFRVVRHEQRQVFEYFYLILNLVNRFIDKATAVVMQYSEMETKVRQVTNNDPWGSSATDMMDLARNTYN